MHWLPLNPVRVHSPTASGAGTTDFLTLRKIEAATSVNGASCEAVAKGWFTRFCLKGRFLKTKGNEETEVKFQENSEISPELSPYGITSVTQ